MKQPITIGADPELFVVNMNNKFISSIGKFGGSKQVPAPIGHDCHIQEDNVALEFNIPPSESKTMFVSSINFALEELAKRAGMLNLSLSIVPSATFDRDQLRNPKAKEFGCDPDHNAWTMEENPRPKAVDKSLRSAGGHVHVGCKLYPAFDIARAMDLFLGVPSVAFDADTQRRKLYGRAGAYREKPYGMEYRTLSNAWLRSDLLKEWVYDQTHAALEFLDVGNRLDMETDDANDIVRCINNTDTAVMTQLVRRFGLIIPSTNELGTAA